MQLNPKDGSIASSLLSVAQTNSIYDPPFTPHDDDSIERITVLGSQEPNPYLIPNMRQAYLDLGYDPNRATVTNLYVRFKPTTAQLAALDSTMDAQGLDLFDTPMDYDVIYEGDYYQDPSIPDSLPTWQYAVVPPNFVFPSGITHETLAQIHIPPDDYTAIETEAENIAGGGLNNAVQANRSIVPNVPQCATGYHWDYNLLQCVPNNCPPGYLWNGTACVPANCQSGYYFDGTSCVPYNNYPPGQAPDAHIPQGIITVFDTNLPSLGNGSELPVRKLRVVARRWFKEERVFTDASGHFVFTKHFKNKVRIIEKFKNADAYIYGIRGVRLWQILFPIKRELGIFTSNNMSNVMFHNDQTGPVNSKGNRYWAAATTHNAVQEHRDYATQFGFTLAPTTINIYLTNWGIEAGLSSTPLFHKRFFKDLPSSFINTFLVNTGTYVVAGGIIALAATIARVNVDMAIDYHTDLATFHSDWLKATIYHELSHASQYNKLGTNWYTQFVNAELAESVKHPNANDRFNPYGDGGSATNSPIIALGEAWGYHMEHFLADQQYGVNASDVTENWGLFPHSTIIPFTAHPYIDAIEGFVPSLSSDPFHWIPKGAMEDLMDNTPLETTVNDQVSGFTISQLFNALQSDVTTVQQYKARILSQNPVLPNGTTSAQVTALFTSYNY